MRQVILICVVACTLAACKDEPTAADITGACSAFDAPVQPVLGKRRIDQKWIDRAVEAGVSVCGWTRPKAEEVVTRAVRAAR